MKSAGRQRSKSRSACGARRPRTWRRRPGVGFSPLLATTLFLLATLGPAPLLGAERPSWSSRTVGPLQLWAPPELEAEIDSLANDAVDWLPRLERALGVSQAEPTRPFAIAVVDRTAWRSAAMQELPVEEVAVRRLDVRAPPWAAGYMLPAERVGVIRLDRVHRYPFDGAPTVLAHEVSHQLMHDLVGERVPRWFDEAVATYEGRRRGLRDVAVLLSTSLFADVPPLRGLDYDFSRSEVRARRAYAASLEFLDWSIRRYDTADLRSEDRLVPRLVSRMAADQSLSFEQAWRQVTGESLLLAEQIWREGRWRPDRWIPVLFMNPTLGWAAMALLAVLAAFVRRRRTLEQRRRWEEEEALADQREWAAMEPDKLVN